MARTILAFVPRPDEPDIRAALREARAGGRALAYPAFDQSSQAYVARLAPVLESEMVAGHFGIPEPSDTEPVVDWKRLDFALVPGLGFGPDGRRLGRGEGYLDRLLASVHAFTCGVAFDEQMVADLPVEPHDVVLHCILTPSREWRATSRRF